MLLADLHLHSGYTRGVSKKITIQGLVKWAKLKGLNLIAFPDAVCEQWVKEQRKYVVEMDGILFCSGIYLIPTAEIETSDRVHHVLIFPSLDTALEFGRRLKNPRNGGRPRVDMDGEELACLAEEIGATIFPAHAFTPYFSLYAHHDSLESCYGSATDYVKALELGLSANTELADRIPGNHRLTYLSFSDAHSYEKMGREFTAIEAESKFKSVVQAIEKGKIAFNAGLDPREGKYHLTACRRCGKKYSLPEAYARGWKCECGGIIKKGVKDRILELSGPGNPPKRPPYKTIVPLAEIFEAAGLGKRKYRQFIEKIPEIRALLFEPLENLPERIRKYVELVRTGEVLYEPGGGGKYGKPLFIFDQEKREKLKRQLNRLIGGQRTLLDFSA